MRATPVMGGAALRFPRPDCCCGLIRGLAAPTSFRSSPAGARTRGHEHTRGRQAPHKHMVGISWQRRTWFADVVCDGWWG